MGRFGVLTAIVLGLAAAYATDALADEVTAAAVSAQAPRPLATCVSLEREFLGAVPAAGAALTFTSQSLFEGGEAQAQIAPRARGETP